MKRTVLSGCVAAFLLISPNIGHAGKVCLFPHTISHTSNDRHCDDGCGGWRERQSVTSVNLAMPSEWAEKGAFFNNPRARCNGVGCAWAELYEPTIAQVGQAVRVSYLHWGRPINVVVEADICILE